MSECIIINENQTSGGPSFSMIIDSVADITNVRFFKRVFPK